MEINSKEELIKLIEEMLQRQTKIETMLSDSQTSTESEDNTDTETEIVEEVKDEELDELDKLFM